MKIVFVRFQRTGGLFFGLEYRSPVLYADKELGCIYPGPETWREAESEDNGLINLVELFHGSPVFRLEHGYC